MQVETIKWSTWKLDSRYVILIWRETLNRVIIYNVSMEILCSKGSGEADENTGELRNGRDTEEQK